MDSIKSLCLQFPESYKYCDRHLKTGGFTEENVIIIMTKIRTLSKFVNNDNEYLMYFKIIPKCFNYTIPSHSLKEKKKKKFFIVQKVNMNEEYFPKITFRYSFYIYKRTVGYMSYISYQ